MKRSDGFTPANLLNIRPGDDGRNDCVLYILASKQLSLPGYLISLQSGVQLCNYYPGNTNNPFMRSLLNWARRKEMVLPAWKKLMETIFLNNLLYSFCLVHTR